MGQWSGRKRRRTDCEQEDGVTAANQISLSLGCLMSIVLCDSHLTTLSTMNTRSTRFSIASLLHSQIREGMHQNGTKTKERKSTRDTQDSVGKFHSCVSVADHRTLPSSSPSEGYVFPLVPHSV